MKTIYLKAHTIDDLFNRLHGQLQGRLAKNLEGCHLKFDNDFAFGEINGICLKENVSFIDYDMVCNEDILLVNQAPSTSPAYFLYCSRGKLSLSFGLDGKRITFGKFQNGIFYDNGTKDMVFLFPKDEPIKVSVIIVNTYGKMQNHRLPWNNTSEILSRTNGHTHLNYIGSYNLKIAEKIKELEVADEKGLAKNLLVKGFVYIILAMQIRQFEEDMRKVDNGRGHLTDIEMESVKEISDFIKNYPGRSYNLKELSRKAGMSQSKLQEGFKIAYGKTVTSYIRDIRLEAAEHLIKHTDMNITEVVYTIGLTSRSYFSKIFKNKYRCSPKKYQENQTPLYQY